MDREKVIKGLECCLGANDCDVEPEEDCPYKGMCLCAMALRFDVLALLKEQEVKEQCLIKKCVICPHCENCDVDENGLLKEQEAILLENQHKPYGIRTNANSPWISRCPKCGKKVEGKQTRFCKYCGQAVKWK